MKISFIIPAHNEEHYIGKTLEAIIAQPKELVQEIIVIDNQSTDGTAEIAKGFQGVTVIKEPTLGLPHARQAGFNKSSGEIIASIDADSIIAADWSKIVIDAFTKNKKISALGGPYFHYNHKSIKGIINYFYFLLFILPVHFIINLFGISGIMLGGNFAVRAAALKEIPDYTKEVRFYGEDAYMAKRFRRWGPIKFSMKLYVDSSPRRFEKEGILKTIFIYVINFIWVVFTGKPLF